MLEAIGKLLETSILSYAEIFTLSIGTGIRERRGGILALIDPPTSVSEGTSAKEEKITEPKSDYLIIT